MKTVDQDGLKELGEAHIQCSVCKSTFRRPEHLKRHLRSHTKEKPFECVQCGRHFSRSDTLYRHETSHHALGSEGKDRNHRITVKTFRACCSCATARVRCSGGISCERCKARSLECQYPTQRRPKTKSTRDSNMRETETGTNVIKHLNRTKDSSQSPRNRPNESTASSEPFLGVGLAYNCANADIPKFAVGASNLEGDMGDLQPVLANAADHTEMEIEHKPEGSMSFNRSLFNQSMPSTINWLPTDLFPEAPVDQIKPAGVSLQRNQSLASGTYSRTAWELPVVTTGQANTLHPQSIFQAPSVHRAGNNMKNFNPYFHARSENSSNAVSVESVKRSDRDDVDLMGSNPPKQRKTHMPCISSPADSNEFGKQVRLRTSEEQFGFPIISDLRADQISKDVAQLAPRIEPSTYEDIYSQFISLCRRENPFYEIFKSDRFPTADELTSFIAFFFGAFQTVYPILHLPTFDPNTCHWLLTMSIIAIGCHVANIPEMEKCTTAFHELIRRGLNAEKEHSRPGQISLEVMQAMLFNCIGLLHSMNERDKHSALSTFGELIALVKNSCLLAPTDTPFEGTSQDSDWTCWIQDEIRRRTGYCIWLVDCTLAYYFDRKPLLSLDDGQASLPADEKFWQASSAEEWKELWEKSSATESLYEAIHLLFIEKRLVSGIDQFSHILLIHALYHRMWEVGDYFRRPLSFWNPTAKKQSRKTAIPTGSIWLPGIPSYSKWRNSACDCLDILHWTANSTMAQATGLEHPTVHLHAARLLLLIPFREMRSFVTVLATEKLPWDKRHQPLEWQYILRWIEHDQYKARLSVIHAGAILWHIRHYSTHAFHEPFVVFTAVLTLWAYGSCDMHRSHKSSPPIQTPHSAQLCDSTLIHLDEPCDDGLVQRFVREGHAMKGIITGVGDICGAHGPESLLRVGCEILRGLNAWSNSKDFLITLTSLADLISAHSWEQTR